MPPFTEDLAAFFDLGDFAEEVQVNGQALPAIFDAAYASPLDVASSRPMLTCRTVDVVGVQVGAAALVRAQRYTVRGIEPDGTGVTRLMVERV